MIGFINSFYIKQLSVIVGMVLFFILPTYNTLASVKLSNEDSFDKVRFDFPVRTEYSVQRFGLDLLIQFNKPVKGDLEGLAKKSGNFIKSISFQDAGREAVVTFTDKHKFKIYRKSNSIVLDVGKLVKLSSTNRASTEKQNINIGQRDGEVKIRVGAHPDYNRIVFEWPVSVNYKIVEASSKYSINFDRFAKLNFNLVRGKLPQYLKEIKAIKSSDGGLSVIIPITNGMGLRHFLSGKKAVFDFSLNAKPKKEMANEKSKILANKAKTVSGVARENYVAEQLGLQSLQTSGSLNLENKVTRKNQENYTNLSKSPSPVKNSPLSGNLSKVSNPTPNVNNREVQKLNKSIILNSNNLVKNEIARGDLNQKTIALLEDPKWIVNKSNVVSDKITNGPRIPVRYQKNNNTDSLRFEWGQSVAAAVFTRAGYLWVVFGEEATFDLSEVSNSRLQIAKKLSQVPVRNGSILRAKIVPGIAPAVWRDGEAWVVDLSPQISRPDVSLRFVTQQTSPQGPRIFVLADGIGNSIEIRDPEVGDRLFIVPVEPLSRGIEETHNFAQFNLLKSTQGLVVNPLIDELEIRVMPDGIAITASKFRGLEVSKRLANVGVSVPSGVEVDGLPSGLEPGRIFNLETWRQGAAPQEFLKFKQNIQQQISQATSIARSGPRLSLAQFYFAKGLAAETMGLLRTISDSNEEMARRPDVVALRGASQFILGRFSEAEKELDNKSLNGFSEAELWRGASNAAQGKWAAAIEHFARAGEIPGDYPRNFSIQLALLAAEAAIRAEDYRGAGVFLDAIAQGRPTIGEQARLNYLRGRVLYASSDISTALNFWRRLTSGSDRWARVRAKRALIEHKLRESTITRPEAIESLERLRFAWRGDQLEFDLLRRLGELYIEEEDFVSGLKALRQAVTFFPNNIFTRKVLKKMTKSFSGIYTDGTSDAMTPLTALALYDQFRELTPVGKRGDKIIQRLADRLVEVDLLDRASVLLDRQVRFRLQGAQKAKVGSRLALIRLLDRQPGTALEALDESVSPGLDKQLSLQRKRLRARSVFALGDSQTALKLIKGDDDREADLLRADIFWRTRNWISAGKVFERLIGNDGQDGRRINELSATLILNWVVALSMSDQKDALNNARQVYATQMDMTNYREAFRLITNKAAGDIQDFRTLTERFKEIGRFQAFLASYKEKLKSKPLSQVN